MAAIKVGTLDVCAREMLATWFYCWSEPEGEGWGCVHWLPQAPGRITASIPRRMPIRSWTFRQQLVKYVVNLLQRKTGRQAFFPVPSMLSPMGTAMMNACAHTMLPLRTASLFATALWDSWMQAQMAFGGRCFRSPLLRWESLKPGH